MTLLNTQSYKNPTVVAPKILFFSSSHTSDFLLFLFSDLVSLVLKEE